MPGTDAGAGRVQAGTRATLPALERAFAAGVPACIDVITDPEIGFAHGGAAAH